ncbi:hypothetical protein PMEGAS228_11910 [Priestia megaterium]
MSCSLVSAPPTLNTMTATRAIQPILSINESAYKVKVLMKYSVYYLYETYLSRKISKMIGDVFNV